MFFFVLSNSFISSDIFCGTHKPLFCLEILIGTVVSLGWINELTNGKNENFTFVHDIQCSRLKPFKPDETCYIAKSLQDVISTEVAFNHCITFYSSQKVVNSV